MSDVTGFFFWWMESVRVSNAELGDEPSMAAVNIASQVCGMPCGSRRTGVREEVFCRLIFAGACRNDAGKSAWRTGSLRRSYKSNWRCTWPATSATRVSAWQLRVPCNHQVAWRRRN